MSGAQLESVLKDAWLRAIREHEHGLSLSDLAVVLLLWSDADDDGLASPSIPELANALGVTDRTVQKHLKIAEGAGVISAPEGRGVNRPTDWQLTIPIRALENSADARRRESEPSA